MIKLIRCIRRNPNISKDEFRNYWTGDERLRHVQQLITHAQVFKVTQNLTLDISFNEQMREEQGCEEEPYDAIMEIWWENYDIMNNALNGEELVKMRGQLERIDKDFIDTRSSPMFFIDEQIIG